MHLTTGFYNSLPSLAKADKGFSDRGRVFDALKKLLSQHGGKYGVCLVHSHCTLNEGEIMLSTDGIAQPVLVSKDQVYYPSHWLASGEPYEYTSDPTEIPPLALFEAFRSLTHDTKFLGLYYVGPLDAEPRIEWTEGRMNLTRKLTVDDWKVPIMETQWNLGRGYPVTMACFMFCVAKTTKSGGIHTGKS
jgi:hypothetical protein